MVLLGSPPVKVCLSWVLRRKGWWINCSSRLCGQTPNREPRRKEGLFGPQFERVQSILAAKKWQNSRQWECLVGTPRSWEDQGRARVYVCLIFSCCLAGTPVHGNTSQICPEVHLLGNSKSSHTDTKMDQRGWQPYLS